MKARTSRFRWGFAVIALALTASLPVCAASPAGRDVDVAPPVLAFAEPPAAPVSIFGPASEPALPRMAPELALATFQQHGDSQPGELAWYSDETEINAVLPDTQQKGNYQLVREFSAPNALAYKPLRFTGDGFIKTNLMLRLLQSDVERVEKRRDGELAISAANYHFAYKGPDSIEGHAVHVFQVKPRRKVPGLFKGRIYLDAATGTLRRAEGTLVKSPSFFIKKIDFVQDYAEVGGFTMPVRTHSAALTRVVGRAIVDIFHRNYQARAAAGGQPQVGAALTAAQF